MKSKFLIFVLFGMFLFGFASIVSALPTAQSIWDPTNVYIGDKDYGKFYKSFNSFYHTDYLRFIFPGDLRVAGCFSFFGGLE